MPNTFTVPWKKNFRKLPSHLHSKLSGFRDRPVRVACAKKIPESDIVNGKYVHLQMRMEEGTPVFPRSIVPNPRLWKCSERNVHGQEVVRRDLPMETQTYEFESPNWGDWGYGSHTVSWSREVYQRDFIPPKELDIHIELLRNEEVGGQRAWVFLFTVNEVIDPSGEGAEGDVLFNINLLQENVGVADIFPADAKEEEYLSTIQVDWEILPPREREDVVAKVLRKYGNPTEEVVKKVDARYRLLMKLKPKAFINGTNGFRHYFGALLADDLVVFENLEHGNAIYVMYQEWKSLSKLSRIALLRMNKTDRPFDRVVHCKGWEDKLIGIVTEEMHSRRVKAVAASTTQKNVERQSEKSTMKANHSSAIS